MSGVNFFRWSILCLASFAWTACEPANVSEPVQAVAAAHDLVKQDLAETATADSAAQPPHGCAAILELNAMDHRKPVPLQPMMAWHQKQNMMEHLVAIQRITDALANEDWDGVAAGAALIETSPQMEQMCHHMGMGADGFTELALDFHRRADKIGVAAKAQDVSGVLRATSNTLQACTSCHATYRQDVVDAATWQSRTGSAHNPTMMHH